MMTALATLGGITLITMLVGGAYVWLAIKGMTPDPVGPHDHGESFGPPTSR